MDNNKSIYVRDNESIDDLQLKGLNLIQKIDGFKFGVDAVLLSDFANVKKSTEQLTYVLELE